MKKINQKPYILALSIFFIFVSLFLFFLFQSRFINFVYRPYLVDYLMLVFTDNIKIDEKNNNLDFLLNDLQGIENKNIGVVSFDNLNSEKNIKSLASFADVIYLDIFSMPGQNEGNFSYFDNKFAISRPFEASAYISESTDIKVIYNNNEERLDFVFLGQPVEINGDLIKLNDIVIYTFEKIKEENLIKISDLVINLSDYNNNLFVPLNDLIGNGIRIYKFEGTNLLQDYNYSFEKGLWTDQAGDCSAYLSGTPQISMSLRSDASHRSSSLELSSSNHFACSFNSFPINLDKSKFYKLVFDYKNIEGEKVQYYYNLKNSQDEIQEKFGSFEASDSNWNTFEAIIDPQIQNPTEMSLYFYAPSEGSKKITNLYDNVKLYSFELVDEILLPKFDFPKNYGLFNWISLKNGINSFRYVNNEENFLDDYNYSFEKGFWGSEVQNCSNHLSGTPQISMSLRSDASHGSSSLELSSSNHFACSFNSFPINLDKSKFYKLVFDYKNIEGEKVQYYYNLKNSQDEIQEKFGSFEASDSNWNTFEAIIDPQIQNPTEMSLYFYAPSEGSKKITNLYDNVKILEIAPKEIYSYYLVSKSTDNKKENIGSISSLMINNLKTKISITEANSSIVIVYPKNYSRFWRIYPAKKYSQFFGFFANKIPAQNHFRINNELNGWIIEADSLCQNSNLCSKNPNGSYNINLVIEHDLNKFFNIGLVLFGIMIIISGYYFVKIKDERSN